MEFFLRGDSVPTDGSGCILITDIILQYGLFENLICHSSYNEEIFNGSVAENTWYLNPKVGTITITVSGEKVSVWDGRGWGVSTGVGRGRSVGSFEWHRIVILRRVSETAFEGKFTCNITGDSNNTKSLLILYPSE